MSEQVSKEKETQILDAAQKRFAYYGFSKATMDEIAGDLGMQKASLYYYFSTKERLFCAVVQREQREFIGNINSIFHENIPISAKLQIYVENRLKYFRELVNLSKLNYQSSFEMKPFFKKLFEDFGQEELKLLVPLFESGVSNGELQIKNEATVARVFLHVLQGLRMRMLRHLKGNQLTEEQYQDLEFEMKLVARMFVHGEY